MVKLPFYDITSLPGLPESRPFPLNRFYSLARKLVKQSEFYSKYSEFIKKYLNFHPIKPR